MPEAATATRIIDLDLWEGRLPVLMDTNRNGKPFPFIVPDALLDPATAQQALQAFTHAPDKGCLHYVHVNEKKYGLKKMDRMPSYPGAVIPELHSERLGRKAEMNR